MSALKVYVKIRGGALGGLLLLAVGVALALLSNGHGETLLFAGSAALFTFGLGAAAAHGMSVAARSAQHQGA
jgi:hypothetical protein